MIAGQCQLLSRASITSEYVGHMHRDKFNALLWPRKGRNGNREWVTTLRQGLPHPWTPLHGRPVVHNSCRSGGTTLLSYSAKSCSKGAVTEGSTL
jgi:hypothetical protein